MGMGRLGRSVGLTGAVGSLLVTLLVAVAPTASATTVLAPAMDRCLRAAARDPAGVVVLTDSRLSTVEAVHLARTVRAMGRTTCVVRRSRSTVSSAFTWWSGLAPTRRPGTVVLAVPGNAAQLARWNALLPARRLIGTVDSGIAVNRRVTAWTRGAGGILAGRAILARLGELMINAHAWGGTSEQLLLHSTAAQCAAAVASPRGVLVLGDSITSRDFAGVHRALKARGYVPCVYAQSSSRIYEHLARLRAKKVPLPQNVIVLLGNNDIFTGRGGYPFSFRLQAKSLLSLLRGHSVVFPTIWRTKRQPFLKALQHNCLVVNNIIRDLARGQSSIKVPDWGRVVLRRPSLQYDGIHLTPAGLAARYDMLSDALDAFMRATPASTPAPTAKPTPTPVG
jgi:lysophospholipase L1-like esterase